MKHSGACPRCEGQVFYRVEEAHSPNYKYANSFRPLALAGFYGATDEKGFFGNPKEGRSMVCVEAWICQSCTYVELYAKDLEVLEKMARLGEGVHLVDRTGEDGPFR